jgi:hypothetical protein
MNKNLQSIIFSLAIVGGAIGAPLSSDELPDADIPVNTLDAGDQEVCAQVDMDSALRSQTKVKTAPGSQSDGDRAVDLEADGEMAVGFGDFLKCWLERDLEGGGSDFTGGCWDRNMGSTEEGTGGSDKKDRADSKDRDGSARA